MNESTPAGIATATIPLEVAERATAWFQGQLRDADDWAARDALHAAIAAAGYRIAEAGAVMITAKAMRHLIDAAEVGVDEYTFTRPVPRTAEWQAAVNEAKAALAAASEPAE